MEKSLFFILHNRGWEINMERIELIDSMKGYAIILVIIGHVIVLSNPGTFPKVGYLHLYMRFICRYFFF